MFLGILAALCLGILVGIITGITPGLHINLVAVLMLSFSPILLSYTSPFMLGVFIVSVAITHTFLDTLPSVYIGAPDGDKALHALPGHRLLLRGKGHSAVIYTLIGSLGSLLLGVLLFPLFIMGMRIVFHLMEKAIAFVLIIVVLYLFFQEREEQRLPSLIIFALASCLGILVFAIPSLHQPLLPLLSGLFGVSLLITSLQETTEIPPQSDTHSFLPWRKVVVSITTATGLGFIAAFLPGLGSSQAAVIGTAATKDLGDEGFLSLMGGISTANMLLSIAAVYALEKARSGAIVAVQQLLGMVHIQELLIFIGVSLAAGGIATLLAIYFSKMFAKIIVKIDYHTIIWCILGFIVLLTFGVDGFLGLIVLITATALGLIASSQNVARHYLMGCLLLPVILYFVL